LTRAGIDSAPSRAPIFSAIPQQQACCAAAQHWTWSAQFAPPLADTPAHYAKVDIAALQKVAQPWPGMRD
jgi:hypothetical protein